MAVTILLRSISFCCRSGLRRSRNLYFKRISSFVFDSVSIGKGGVSASAKMRTCLARTSISPVARFSFTAPPRFSTVPVTAITNSLRIFSALAKASSPQSASSKISCKMPERSRRSTNMIPPLFLCFCTQPITVTVSPTFFTESSPQRWLLFNPCIDSAIFPSFFHPVYFYR